MNKKVEHFVIFKIDDRAIDNVLDIKQKLKELKEIDFECFNVYKEDLESKMNSMKISLNNWSYTKKGEVGVWITFLLFLNKMIEEKIESVLCLEDDAILSKDFYSKFLQISDELPEDYDFLTMAYPKASRYLYKKDAEILNKNICIAKYNYFGTQCILWSRKGSKKFIDLVKRDNIGGPPDIILYRYVENKELNGFSVTPEFEQVVFHDLSRYKSTIDPKNSRGTLEF
jgi:GR25 family glycosyltransferase involved in LPS biosynthesis